MLIGYRSSNHPQQVSKRGPVSNVDDRATDPEVFVALHRRFNFSIDVCASAKNRKMERFYSIDEDGLSQSWAGETVWCNPPYSDIAPWVQKAHSEYLTTKGIVMLLPANRTEQGWWQYLVEPHLRRQQPWFTCEFLPGRIRFIHPDKECVGPNERPPFGCCLLIWRSCLDFGQEVV